MKELQTSFSYDWMQWFSSLLNEGILSLRKDEYLYNVGRKPTDRTHWRGTRL